MSGATFTTERLLNYRAATEWPVGVNGFKVEFYEARDRPMGWRWPSYDYSAFHVRTRFYATERGARQAVSLWMNHTTAS